MNVKKTKKETRKRIFLRDGYKCSYCGKIISDDGSRDLQLDHVIPICDGGQSIAGNLAVCCRLCNSSKNTKRIDREYEILSQIHIRNVACGISDDCPVLVEGFVLYDRDRPHD